MTGILSAARSGYQAGLCLLPVREDGSKAPDVPSWIEYKRLRPTVEDMRGYHFDTRAGYGLIGGDVSGRVDPWDFDCPETFDAFVAAAHACGLGPVVDRIRAGYEDVTPKGGRRWLVRYPEGGTFTDTALARRPRRDDDPATPPAIILMEITTFSVLAPSNGGTHPSGKPYVRASGDFGTIATYTADERDALIELARGFDQMPRREHAPPKAQAVAAGGLRPGDAFIASTTWAGLLEPAGWTRVYDRGDTSYWRRPGKAHGISATTNHGGSDLFYPFTSSSEFESDTSYSRFGVYTVLRHGGDYASAARALGESGYGEQRRPTRERSTEPPLPPAAGVSWRWLADVQREQVHWLWPSRLAYGTLTLWIGDGGLGKSRASNDIAARVTTGASWPDGGTLREPANVVILSAEDSASYTIRPAIEAVGGDVRRVATLDAVTDGTGNQRTFQLATDLAALEQLIEYTDARLVIVDPLSAYFGTRLDSYRDTDVRAVLEPLCRLAERRQLAVLGIMHIGKGTDRQARHRALGSVAFVNAARLVFAVGADPEDVDRRLLVSVKANLCREAPALAFRLADAGDVARVVWETASDPGISADLVLNGKPALDHDADQQDAKDVIHALLADEAWPLDAKIALDAGRAHGIHERTMRRGARQLGIEIRKLGFRGGWRWHRPAEGDTTTPGAPDDDGAAKRTGTTGPIPTVSAGVSPSQADSLKPPMISEGDTKGTDTSVLSPSRVPFDAMEASKGPVSPCASSQKNQHSLEGAKGTKECLRAREDAGAPNISGAPVTSPAYTVPADAPWFERTAELAAEQCASGAAFADAIEAAIAPQPGRCIHCSKHLTHPRAGEPCSKCKRLYKIPTPRKPRALRRRQEPAS